jgi:glycosyltransferase involved in cell wall biosynthesis
MANSGTKALVSVVLPFYSLGNQDFLDEACRSILAQTYASIELLVIVNGPDALRVRDSLASRIAAPDLRLIVSERPGIAAALNVGIAASHGQFIARMDADDIAVPERLARQIALMEEQGLDVCGSALRRMDESGKPDRRAFWQPATDRAIRFCLHFFSALPHPTVVLRRQTALAGMDYVDTRSEDYDLWLRLKRCPSLRFGACPEPLLHYRLHNGQATAKANARAIAGSDRKLKYREFRVTGNPLFLLGILPLSGVVRRMAGTRVVP